MAKHHHGDQFWQVFHKGQYWVHNDLPNKLKSNAKLFTDDTSLFTIVKDENKSANFLNNNLSLISEWAFNWKILFNPDPMKPAQEVLFSRKKKTVSSDIKPQ